MNRIMAQLAKYARTEWNKGEENPAEVYFHRAVLITNILMNASLGIVMACMFYTLMNGFGLIMQFGIMMLVVSLLATASIWFFGLITQPHYWLNAMKKS